jgi:hypothetical protein
MTLQNLVVARLRQSDQTGHQPSRDINNYSVTAKDDHCMGQEQPAHGPTKAVLQSLSMTRSGLGSKPERLGGETFALP